MTGRRVLPVLVLAILAVLGTPRDALAWGRGGCFGWAASCYGVSAGCYGGASACYGTSASCYGVSSGCYGTSSCYAVRHSGPLRRLVAGIRSRRAAAYACYGSCYGSSCYGCSGCYGSSCYGSNCYGSSGCYVACYGSATSSCYSGPNDGCYHSADYNGYSVGSTYAAPPTSQPMIQPQAAPPTVAPSTPAPAAETPSTATPPAGDQTRSESVAITTVASDATPPSTLLRLRVPAHAKVVLEDTETRLTGAERTFRTSRLTEGEVWSNYCVRVVMEREGGEAAVQEKYLDLRGGESHELRFDFDDSLLASH